MYAVVDVGTTGVKLFVYDKDLRVIYRERIAMGFKKVGNNYLEQDSGKIFDVVLRFIKKAREKDAKYLGLTTYRASLVAWRKDGKPLTNVITWIDKRGLEVTSRFPLHLKLLSRVGILKPILSIESPAVLEKWMIDNVSGLFNSLKKGDAFIGTLDSFLAYRLTGHYISDATNISLTGLIHPRTFKPINMVFNLLKLPPVYPEVVDNIGDFGEIEGLELKVLIADQQAAIIAENCLEKGCIKVTHGTGSFVDVITGSDFTMVGGGVIPIVVYRLDGKAIYGVEGFIPTTGIVLDWLLLKGFYKSYEEFNEYARGGGRRIFFLPSFRGLRVPYVPDLRGVIADIDLTVDKSSVAYSFLEAIAFLTYKILSRIKEKVALKRILRANGGLSKSDTLLELTANITGLVVERQRDIEASARGTALLLKVASGDIQLRDISSYREVESRFQPSISGEERKQTLDFWEKGLKVVLGWRF